MMAHKTNILIESGFALGKEVKIRKVKAMWGIESHFDKIIKEIQLKKAQTKLKYSDALKVEEMRINREQENFEKHLSLVNFCKENVVKSMKELQQLPNKQIKGTEITNKLENFKRNEEEFQEQTEKLVAIQMSYPEVEFNLDKLEASIKNSANVYHRIVKMT